MTQQIVPPQLRTRHTPTPTAGPFAKVVVCVDATPMSREVVRCAAEMASNYDSEVHLVHVFYPPWRRLHYRAPTLGLSAEFQADYRRRLQLRLEQILGDELRRLDGLRWSWHLVEFVHPADGIVEYTRRSGADLVVLGVSTKHRLRHKLFGTTAEHVLRQVSCSVMTVRPDDAVKASH